MRLTFRDRSEAGRYLAMKLMHYAHRRDVVILGLPRGGIPVAYEVARVLDAPLEAFIVRKLGVPGQEELAMGAIASGGVRYLNWELIRHLDISNAEIEAVTRREHQEIEQRERLYRDHRSLPSLRGCIGILVDDGLATGASMWAAVAALRRLSPTRIVVAVPVAAEQTCMAFRDAVDEVVCAKTPDPFHAVGLWYESFQQVNDEEVRALLHRLPEHV